MNKKRHVYQRGVLHFSLALIIAGAITIGTFFYTQVQNLFKHGDTAPAATLQSQNSVVATQPGTPAAISKPSTTTPFSKDCGTDMNCFIAQASTCGPASVEFSDTINLFGAGAITTTSNIVIGKTTAANTCSFTKRTDKMSAVRLNSKGVPVGPSQSDDTSVGIMEACRAIPAAKLVAVLTNWNKGNFDSNDLADYNCKTTLPKSLTDGMAKQEQAQANAPTTDPFADANNPHQVFDGLAANVSTVGTNGYQFNVSAVTGTTITLQLRGSDANAPAIPVTLTMNIPQTYFGYSFTLTSTKNEYGDYIGTVTTDKI
jgi:hypothetical protein